MNTMPTMMDDHLTQAGERAFQEDYEKFKRESFEHLRKRRETKERQDRTTEQPVESVAVET